MVQMLEGILGVLWVTTPPLFLPSLQASPPDSPLSPSLTLYGLLLPSAFVSPSMVYNGSGSPGPDVCPHIEPQVHVHTLCTCV